MACVSVDMQIILHMATVVNLGVQIFLHISDGGVGSQEGTALNSVLANTLRRRHAAQTGHQILSASGITRATNGRAANGLDPSRFVGHAYRFGLAIVSAYFGSVRGG